MINDQGELTSIWHPCSQMKDYETFRALKVKSAQGSYIQLEDGKLLIDAISSWWCKSLGHNHPRLKQALIKQTEKFEHVIFANTTHETIIQLSHKLSRLTPLLTKVFYAGDGSSAVEIAMKMSLHARVNNGEVEKKKFIALQNSYHGETTGALSVSDVKIYKSAYSSILFDVYFIAPIPYVTNQHDPLWNDCSDHWKKLEKDLEQHADSTTAIILEPIVQGSGGMLIYSPDFLRRIRAWATKHNIHLIADEIMTGLGRTGKILACQHANIEPDFLLLGKGLTGGWMPFSAVLTSNEIFQIFYDDYAKGKSFLHSHTYSGNALAASVALEVMKLFEEVDYCQQANLLGRKMLTAMHEIQKQTSLIKNVRQLGAIVAADLACNDLTRRLGYRVYQHAVKFGALLRPLANTIYWLPPLNTEFSVIDDLQNITMAALISAIA